MSEGVAISEHPEGATLAVWVIPGAKRFEIAGRHGSALRVRVAVPAEKGRANRAVESTVKKALGARHVYVDRGHRSRSKRLVIVGMAPSEVARKLG